jgi:hypothetical protein
VSVFKRRDETAPRDPPPKGHERIALCERCQFEIAGSGAPREGVVWNVSAVGLYLVVHSDIPPEDATVIVSLWLPGDPRPLRAEAQVVWRNPPSHHSGSGAKAFRFPPGCGLKFVDIAEADLARIRARVEVAHANRPDAQRDSNQR